MDTLSCSYDDLLALSTRQLEILQHIRVEDSLQELLQLDNEKQIMMSKIDLLIKDNFDYTLSRDFLITKLTILTSLNQQIQLKIDQWYSDDSKSMKQISVHRKTLQSYGGINDVDVVSYYIDSKK